MKKTIVILSLTAVILIEMLSGCCRSYIYKYHVRHIEVLATSDFAKDTIQWNDSNQFFELNLQAEKISSLNTTALLNHVYACKESRDELDNTIYAFQFISDSKFYLDVDTFENITSNLQVSTDTEWRIKNSKPLIFLEPKEFTRVLNQTPYRMGNHRVKVLQKPKFFPASFHLEIRTLKAPVWKSQTLTILE